MRRKIYRININPIPCQRTVRNANRCYDNDAKERVSFALYLAQQHNEEPLFLKPVHLDVIFYMPYPRVKKQREEHIYHTQLPYLENLYKFLVQSLKDVVIPDERVISSLSLKKVYDNEPRTEFIITEVV